MYQRGRRVERRFEIDDSVDRLHIHDYVLERVLGHVAAFSHHHDNRLANMTDFVPGQRDLRACMKNEPLNWRGRHEERPGLPVVAQISGGVNGHDPGFPTGCGDIDPSEAAVRVIASHEAHVQHSRQLDIIDEKRPAGQQPRIFVSDNPLTDVAWRHRLCVTRLTASTMFWYPVQRQRFPDSVSRISGSLGCGWSLSRATSVMRMPGVQKPHCRA
jgi:hypothetical protein